MGGMRDMITGASKAEAYGKYLQVVENLGPTFLEHHPDPKYKKACKRQMVQDPQTGEWVLHFYLHT